MASLSALLADMKPKQARFVVEYLIDLNAAQAAIRAGYSERTARQQGSKLLTKPDIAAAVAAGCEERNERTQTDADWVLQRLRSEADADIADIYDDNDNLLPIRKWPKVFRTGLIAGMEVVELFDGTGKDRVKTGELKKPKFSDRAKRYELIGRHVTVGAFKDKLALDPTENIKSMFREMIEGNAIRPKEEQG